MNKSLRFGYLVPTRDAVMRSPGGRADIRPIVDLGVKAEQMGFDSVWVGDSILAKPRFEPLTTLAAIAARTTRVELGTAVYLTPLRHPVPLAHTVCNLDLLSGGRFLFGIGLGPGAPQVKAEYAACGIDWHQRGRRQEEGLEIMKGLWTGKPFTYDGKIFQLEQAILHPLPAREGGPPVLMAGAAERPLRRAARLADGWLPISPSPQEFASNWEKLWNYTVAAGRDPEKLLRILYVTLNVNRDEAKARQGTEEFHKNYYGAGHEAAARSQAHESGAPERCADFLRSFAKVGVSHFVVRFATSDQQTQMERLMADVIPAVGPDSEA